MTNWKDSKQKFLDRWPLDKVEAMTLEEYTNTEKDDSFTYWLSTKTSDVIGTQGSFPHSGGIYKTSGNNNNSAQLNKGQDKDQDNEYIWYSRYGGNKTDAFLKVKVLLVAVIKNALNKQFSDIDDINLAPTFKWKIAYMYAPEGSLIKIASDKAMKYLCETVTDVQLNKISEIHQQLIKAKPENESFDDYSSRLWLMFDEYEKGEKLKKDKTNSMIKSHKEAIKMPLNQILFGPPGTGKTYNTIKKSVEIIDPEFAAKNNWEEIKQEFDELMKQGQIVFTTFHQSMAYEDFVEGLKPISENGQVTYDVLPGLFKKLCIKASSKETNDFEKVFKDFTDSVINSDDQLLELKTKTGKSFWVGVNSNGNITLYTTENKNPQGTLTKEKLQIHSISRDSFRGWEGYADAIIAQLKSKHNLINSEVDLDNENFVLIIDEINRGNVSAIFGELITLIEESKRKGKNNIEALEVTLPYSKEKFSVPDNLYIIGTMNTADRSVEALDSALRRRFSFTEMPPKSDLIKQPDFLVKKYQLSEILDTINERIEVLLDKDHLIGHSFFMKVKNLADLKRAFSDEIIPLLQEYFFGDYGKISMVLGEGFCVGKKVENHTKVFADTNNDYDDPDCSDKLIYKFPTLEEDYVFIGAIKKLLKSTGDGE